MSARSAPGTAPSAPPQLLQARLQQMHKCPPGQRMGVGGGGTKPVSSWMPTTVPSALAGSWRGEPCAGGSGQGQSPFPCPVAAPHPSTHRGALPGVGGGGRAGLGEAGVHGGVVGVPGQGRTGAHGVAGERRLGQGPPRGLQGRARSGGFARGRGNRRGPPHPRIQQRPGAPTPDPAVPPWGAAGCPRHVPPCPLSSWGAGGSPGRWRGRAWAGAGRGSWPGCSHWTHTRGW